MVLLARRAVLRALCACVATAPAVPLLTGCSDPQPPDPLLALLAQARADAELVDAVARRTPELGAGLAPVAEARRAHADALVAELGEDAPPPEAPTVPANDADPAADIGLAPVVAALDAARRDAAALVPVLPRDRAGLVGSIAACCAAYRSVLT